ncbi:hypothetical protein PVK06_002043 [Gossypium arboreum]|uniref:RNase H type-1 domain-containing protein n=1 Tax=Gossypium arboreum TaxID=29729 RepID=A0ABR0R2P5_GOSAR|nr:hypothetical protein PVK06_002043 [Gossypium arboreum]
MEQLGHCIDNVVEQKTWSPLKLSRSGPDLSHLFFVDDLMLFCEVDRRQATLINGIFNDFCYFSGQKIGPLRAFFRGFGKPNDTLHVCYFVDSNGDWDWSQLRCLIPDNVVNQITTMLPPTSDAGLDQLAWKWMMKENFSSFETYMNLCMELSQMCYFMLIWDSYCAGLPIFKGGLIWAKSYATSSSSLFKSNPMVTNYHWSPPKDGWIKLNMDRAVPSNNANIDWRSVLEELRIAWDKGFRQIELECDNVVLVESLLAGSAASSKIVELQLIYEMMHQE